MSQKELDQIRETMESASRDVKNFSRETAKSLEDLSDSKDATASNTHLKDAIKSLDRKDPYAAMDESYAGLQSLEALNNSMEDIIKNARKRHKHVEVEVENQKDAILAANCGAAIVMLDNFSPIQIKKTITALQKKKLRNKVKLEASGGINSKNITAYAKTGVDIISVGSITNSVSGLDLSLEVCV